MTATFCFPLRNVDPVRERAYESVRAVLAGISMQDRYAVLETVRDEFPESWPMEGDSE